MCRWCVFEQRGERRISARVCAFVARLLGKTKVAWRTICLEDWPFWRNLCEDCFGDVCATHHCPLQRSDNRPFWRSVCGLTAHWCHFLCETNSKKYLHLTLVFTIRHKGALVQLRVRSACCLISCNYLSRATKLIIPFCFTSLQGNQCKTCHWLRGFAFTRT